MKRISIGLILLSSLSHACPTCVGHIEQDSPAFFRDEFYAPTAQEAKNEKTVDDESDTQEDA